MLELDVRRRESGAYRAEPALNVQTTPHECCIGIHAAPEPLCMSSTTERSPSSFWYWTRTAK